MTENSNPQKPRRPFRGTHTPEFRHHAILPLLRFRAAQLEGKHAVIVFLDANVPDVTTLDQFASLRAEKIGVSARSLWRWYTRFAAHGYQGLLDAPRRDRGRSHYFDRHPFARVFVFGKAADGLSAAAIHRELLAAWPRLGEASNPPARTTVRAYLASLRLPEVQS